MNRWYADRNPQHIVLSGSATCTFGTTRQVTENSKPAPGRRL